jgi:Uma2 family endonuclease
LLARLLEAWAEETDTPLEGAGSWTVRDAAVERGAEADECYALGTFEGKKAPDIVIEVVWTSGGIDKLEVWRKLGAREVWFWILPKLDPELIARCMRESTQTAAVKTLRAEMRRPKKRAKK